MPAAGSTSLPVHFPDRAFHSLHYSAKTCHVRKYCRWSCCSAKHLFIISPNYKLNHHLVHKVPPSLVELYLNDINCHVTVIHEFTDGCSAQYKSRHCIREVSNSPANLGFTNIRNFLETSHAKGCKKLLGQTYQANMAIIKQQVCSNYTYSLYVAKVLFGRCNKHLFIDP